MSIPLQEILRDLEFKFEELRDFENFTEVDEIKKNAKEPKRKRAAGGLCVRYLYHVTLLQQSFLSLGIVIPSADVSKLLPNDSVCTTDMKDPLGSSTPTETSSTTSADKENCVKQPVAITETRAPVITTPPNEFKW